MVLKKGLENKISNASSEEYETDWDDAGKITKQKKKSNIKRGKSSKAAGTECE